MKARNKMVRRCIIWQIYWESKLGSENLPKIKKGAIHELDKRLNHQPNLKESNL